jgi:ubiquinone/menaquinone biosynthesis C-methylase UbiE
VPLSHVRVAAGLRQDPSVGFARKHKPDEDPTGIVTRAIRCTRRIEAVSRWSESSRRRGIPSLSQTAQVSIASRPSSAPSQARPIGRIQQAWTEFWKDPAQSHCVAGASDIQFALANHWSTFAQCLASGTRVLDLGCGAGAVARLLLNARSGIHVTGIDFARIPLSMSENVELLSETAMESLPFGEASFGAAVSQFGFEYGQLADTVRELERVLAPGARISFLVHHADSAIVSTNRSRLAALEAFLAPAMRSAFCAADVAGFQTQLAALVEAHPDDTLVAELARALPSRLSREPRERSAIWNAVEDALMPERCLAEALNACCVSRLGLEPWLEPLRAVSAVTSVSILRERDGSPVAWKIDGLREGPSGR